MKSLLAAVLLASPFVGARPIRWFQVCTMPSAATLAAAEREHCYDGGICIGYTRSCHVEPFCNVDGGWTPCE
jgi:hypothetical protein